MEQGRYVPLVRVMMVKEKNIPYMAKSVNKPKKVVDLAKKILSGADREHFLMLSVDNQIKPLAIEIVSIGTVNRALVHAREVFKHAILANATYIVTIHNHISGNCTPSLPDMELTEQLAEIGRFMGIPLIDHVIVGDGYFSFREENMLPECEGDSLYIVS